MATSKAKLVILNEIKKELIDKSTFITALDIVDSTKDYLIHITIEDWHKIFKTEEYNERFR